MMKLIFAGKFDGDESKLPQREHAKGAVPFKEPDMKKLAIVANIGACITMILLLAVLFLYAGPYIAANRRGISLAWLCALLSLVPHEFLHAICFRETVSMYNNLSKGMLFVVGTEEMSKLRFVLMSLCPNLVFGLIPYVIGFVFPQWMAVGVFGAVCLGMGFGDYINVFNALTQMPKGAKTYLNGFHSYWYMP